MAIDDTFYPWCQPALSPRISDSQQAIFSSLTEPLKHNSWISLIKESSNFSLKEALSLKVESTKSVFIGTLLVFGESYNNVKILESSVKPHFNDEMFNENEIFLTVGPGNF